MLYIVLFIVLAVFGVVMIVKPDFGYALTESWKHDGESEPSESYISWMRIKGAIVILVSITAAVVFSILHYRGEL